MSDETVRQAGPGPLSQVQDPVVARELRNIWGVLSARSGQVGDDSTNWVTLSQLDAAKREVISKIPVVDDKFSFPAGGSNTTIVGGSGEGLDLRPLDNVWTGSNTYLRPTVLGAPTVQIASFAPTMPKITPASTGTPSIMLETNLRAALDVRKTTEHQVEANSGGGVAAIYVQHRINDGYGGINTVNSGIRVQVETYQRKGAAVNDVVGGYFGLYNQGFDTGAFGVHVDLYHMSTGGTVSYGMSVEMYRGFLDGKVIGFHVRAISEGIYNKDANYGFLASPQYAGSASSMEIVFSAGSNYIGALACDVAFDAAHASCRVAALRVRPNALIELNGASNNVNFYYNPVGKIQFFADKAKTISIGNDGSVRIKANKYLHLNDKDTDTANTGFLYSGGTVTSPGVIAVTVEGINRFSFGGDGTLAMLQVQWVNSQPGSLRIWAKINIQGTIYWFPCYN